MNKMTYVLVGYVLYTVMGSAHTFCLGYGVSVQFDSALDVFDTVLLVGLIFVSIAMIARCFVGPRRGSIVRGLFNIAVFMISITFTLEVQNRTAKAVRNMGAITKLNKLGGKAFESQLIEDAKGLVIRKRDSERAYIDYEELPDTFRRLGGKYARKIDTPYAGIEIVTSGRPTATGWFVVTEDGSYFQYRAVKVSDHIYRY